MRKRSTLAHMVLAAALAGSTFATVGGHATAQNPPIVFSGSASALGVRITIVANGAPLTNTPVDGGGPTAQAAADSLGSSTGYAALPDPGQFVVSLPGLATGAFSTGAGGLPPISLPTLPDYPFSVRSDGAGPLEQHAGSGPYSIAAKSGPNTSSASALVGLQTGLVGDAALVRSTASIAPNASSDAVIATATSSIDGLAIGPISLGRVEATATATASSGSDAKPELSSELEVSLMTIGGMAVSVTPTGLELANTALAVPIGDTLTTLLSGAGITITLQAAQEFEDRVVAPTLTITMPYTVPPVQRVGSISGTATVVLGGATAAMAGITPTEGPAASPDEPAAQPAADFGMGDVATDLPDLAPSATAVPSSQTLGPSAPVSGARPIFDQLDIRTLFAVMAAAAVLVLLAGRQSSRLGEPW